MPQKRLVSYEAPDRLADPVRAAPFCSSRGETVGAMKTRTTHTYAVLELSPAAYSEIREKLAAAGYQHAFHDDLIDMQGIAVAAESGGQLGLVPKEAA